MKDEPGDLVVGIFGVVIFPDMDGVRSVLYALPTGCRVVTGYHAGPEKETLKICEQRNIPVVPMLTNVYRTKKKTYERSVVAQLFDVFKINRMILFFSNMQPERYNYVDICKFAIASRERKIPLKIIKPSGVFY